ncbi:retrovirus-related pol polyprotein from transposon TNT 1-94 [Tanacetum coccineum]
MVKVNTTPGAITEGAWGFEHTKKVFMKEVIPFLKSLKELFNDFDKGLNHEITKVKTVFEQMETAVEQCFIDKKYFEIEKKELVLEHERLLKHIIYLNVKNVLIHANANCLDNDNFALEFVINEYKSMEKSYVDEYSENLKLKAELAKKNDMVEKSVYNELSNKCLQLEHRCISLEIKLQQSKEREIRRNGNQLEKYFLLLDIGGFLQKNVPPKPNTNVPSPEVKIFHRRKKVAKAVRFNDTPSILGPKTSNIKEPNHIWGSKIAISPSSSNVHFRSSTLSSVAFRKHTCFVRNLEGVDLIFGSRDTNLYTISLDDMFKSFPICLLSKASKTKSSLWHRWLSHLNFGTLNQLAKQGLVQGLPKLKFKKDHLCSTCSLGKSKKSSQKPKAKDINQEKLYLLHMDLCGPMRVESIYGNKYILVIVDDY